MPMMWLRMCQHTAVRGLACRLLHLHSSWRLWRLKLPRRLTVTLLPVPAVCRPLGAHTAGASEGGDTVSKTRHSINDGATEVGYQEAWRASWLGPLSVAEDPLTKHTRVENRDTAL